MLDKRIETLYCYVSMWKVLIKKECIYGTRGFLFSQNRKKVLHYLFAPCAIFAFSGFNLSFPAPIRKAIKPERVLEFLTFKIVFFSPPRLSLVETFLAV